MRIYGKASPGRGREGRRVRDEVKKEKEAGSWEGGRKITGFLEELGEWTGEEGKGKRWR